MRLKHRTWPTSENQSAQALRTPEGGPLPPNSFAELRRDMARLRFVMDQIREIEETRLRRLEHSPNEGSHPMVRLLACVIGVGIETADMLVHEILSRNLRDQRAVARYAGLTGRRKRQEATGKRTRQGWQCPQKIQPTRRRHPWPAVSSGSCRSLPDTSEPAPPDRNRWPRGLWRVCALAFPAGATVLFILGRAGAETARGE